MKLLAFGIVKDIFSDSSIDIDINNISTVEVLKELLEKKYPQLSKLGSYMIAINNEYASADETIHEKDEVAIIPPVSGG